MAQSENGASDNRLTWSPAEFPDTAKWKDGEEYTVTAKIRQTAPGEAVILELTGQPGEGEAEPAEAPAGEQAAPEEQYENPAIARAMASRKGA